MMVTRMLRNETKIPDKKSRAENFGYVCQRCLKCCQHKRIQLNPYEVARLARNLGQTTGEFRAACTVNGDGLVLRQTETGTCVFLGSDGCSVHADRPLVCRLYPLGRHVRADGSEYFSHTNPHPQSRGEYTGDGTIADFLVSQDAAPFMQAADEYFFWLCAARAATQATMAEPDGRQTAECSADDGAAARDLLDMDHAIASHCAAAHVAEPKDIERRKELHLKILYREIDVT
jgi:uncharacterized protein